MGQNLDLWDWLDMFRLEHESLRVARAMGLKGTNKRASMALLRMCRSKQAGNAAKVFEHLPVPSEVAKSWLGKGVPFVEDRVAGKAPAGWPPPSREDQTRSQYLLRAREILAGEWTTVRDMESAIDLGTGYDSTRKALDQMVREGDAEVCSKGVRKYRRAQ